MDESTIAIVLSGLLSFILFAIYFDWKLKPFAPVGDIISSMDGQSSKQTKQAFNSLIQIGEAAGNISNALNDEEEFEDLALKIAQKVKTVLTMTVLGTKGGSVKKMQKAERLVNEGIVKATKQISPALDFILKITGIGEELESDPELFGPIMQIITEKGLIDQFMPMIQNMGGMNLDSLSVPKEGTESSW